MNKGTRWALALAFYILTTVYMVMIFYLSSLSSIDQPGPLGKLSNVDKLEHSVEFLVLGLLLFFSFHYTASAKIRDHAWAMAIMVGILYAISDEVHQIFVPDRTADLLDLLVDSAGISVASMVGVWMSERRTDNVASSQARPVAIDGNRTDSEE